MQYCNYQRYLLSQIHFALRSNSCRNEYNKYARLIRLILKASYKMVFSSSSTHTAELREERMFLERFLSFFNLKYSFLLCNVINSSQTFTRAVYFLGLSSSFHKNCSFFPDFLLPAVCMVHVYVCTNILCIN